MSAWIRMKGAEIGQKEDGTLYTLVPEEYAAAHRMKSGYTEHAGEWAGAAAVRLFMNYVESRYEDYFKLKLSEAGYDPRTGKKKEE